MQENARIRYKKDFKIGAVKLVTDEGWAVADVARELGVSTHSIYAWLKEAGVSGENAFPGSGNLKPKDEEVRQLREQLRRVTMERDVLKKTMGYFVERPK